MDAATTPRRHRFLRSPAPTIRLRLTLLYGGVFLVTGVVLLTVGYLLVRSNLTQHHALTSKLQRLGLSVKGDHLLSRALGFAPGSPELKLARAVQQQIENDALNRLFWEYVGALLATTLVAVGTGWWLAGRALRPLRAITATARRVSGENLGERIALRGPADELRELANTFDGMLARLDGAFASQRRFVANASHELRTPLAIMRTEVDVALADPDASRGELRAMGEAVRETVDRCEQLISSLLVLARSEASAGPEEAIDIAVLAGDCITDLRVRAREARVRVRDDLDPAWTTGEPALLERMVANLLDNGIHHNEPGGFLDVSTRMQGGRVLLNVSNGGPVIDPADAEQLTQPFRRLDRSGGGFGLGLSIVRSVAEAHGGTTEVSARRDGGLEVLVSLPAREVVSSPAAPRPDQALSRR
ncbi:MAG TPA: HAMP domain-containing sensor histidine kinase [Solirubrobacteraceae bacterium]